MTSVIDEVKIEYDDKLKIPVYNAKYISLESKKIKHTSVEKKEEKRREIKHKKP